MPRYALKVEYDGKPYHGWQRQRDVPSVQQTIEIAISKIASENPEIQGAGLHLVFQDFRMQFLKLLFQ